MFTTLKKAADVRKDTNDVRFLFQRIEKSGLPALISEASLCGDYEIKFYPYKSGWDKDFVSKVRGVLTDLGYKVDAPDTVTFMTISWEEDSQCHEPTVACEEDEYL